jgi:RHS repeat-associated protein
VTYDRNSRVTGRTDANGNATVHHFDALDRCDIQTFADGSISFTKFDADDDVIQTTDPNGTIIQRTYDGISRLVKVAVTQKATNLAGTGQSVLGTNLQAFEYDGLSRLRTAFDDNGDATNLGVACDYTFDSLGRKLTERHRINAAVTANNVFTTNGRISVGAAALDRTVTSGYAPPAATPNAVYPVRTSLAYSSGTRTLSFGIDGLDRTQTLSDASGSILGYEFVGGRPKVKDFGNGVSEAFTYDTDRRLTQLTHTHGSSLIAGFSYQWDAANQRTFEQALHGTQRRDTYSYDSLYRVVSVSGSDGRTATYQFDGVHNFVRRDEGDASSTVTTKFNARVNGAYAFDFLNRYSKIDVFDQLGTLTRTDAPVHDTNGSRIADSSKRFWFDAFSRLVRVDRFLAGSWRTAGIYTYDPMGRRATKNANVYDDLGNLVRVDQLAFVNDGSREIEELRLSDGSLVADYVYGSLYVDEPVQMNRGGATYYLHANSMFSTAAVTDASGNVVEKYDYRSIYGSHQVTDASGTVLLTGSAIGNPWRFQGRRFDEESGLYHYRARMLDPAEGRFVSRDPVLDPANLGNQYAFCGGNPVNRVDPTGEDGLWDNIKSVGNALKNGREPDPG